jgi:hypothetical protein
VSIIEVGYGVRVHATIARTPALQNVSYRAAADD